MSAVLERGNQTKEVTRCKTFAFRCKWTEHCGSSKVDDGYTYSISKPHLTTMIKAIERSGDYQTYSRHSEIKVVPIGIELYDALLSSPNKCLTTMSEKHILDFEKQH